jgi:hypothetical protein
MTNTRARKLLPLAALVLGGLSCSQPAGVRLDVEVGGFAQQGRNLTVVLHSSTGFKDQGPMTVDNGALTAETLEFDGDDSPDIVVKFLGPFPATKSFRVTMGASPEVTVWANAVLFDETTKLIAQGTTTKQTLAAGGRLTLDIKMDAPPVDAPPVTATTRDTDLASDKPKVTTVSGPGKGAGISAVAACDVNGDGLQDLVIGVPNATARDVDEAAGAVFVLLAPFASNDVALSSGDPKQFVTFGAAAGDHLGAAVACANLDNDTFDDFVAGAPDAVGSGRVYGFTGRTAFATAKKGPDVTWGPMSTTVAEFGSVLLAADFDGDKKTEIVVSALGSLPPNGTPVKPVIHVLRPVATADALIDVDKPDHPTVSGVPAASLAAGDLDGSGAGVDLVLGVPTYKVAGDTTGSGAIVMLANVDATMNTQYDGTLADPKTGYTTRMVGDVDTQFGKAVLVMNTRGLGDDLYVGAPTAGLEKRGLVYAFKHDDGFFPVGGTRNFDPTKTPKLDAGEAGAHFGSALAACASGTPGAPIFSLGVGAPDATRVAGRAGVGAAYLFSGGTVFDFPLIERMYGAAPGDRVGTSVACGQLLDGDLTAEIVAVSPFANESSGALYLRASRPPQ